MACQKAVQTFTNVTPQRLPECHIYSGDFVMEKFGIKPFIDLNNRMPFIPAHTFKDMM